MEDKKKTLTIRLSSSRLDEVKKMAEVFGMTPSRLASELLEIGFLLADAMKGKGDENGIFQ